MPVLNARRSVARNIWLSVLGQALPITVGVFAIPVVARSLGEARFGLLGLIWALFGTMALFDLGLSRATTRAVAAASEGDREFVSRLTSSVTAAQAALGALAAGLLWPLRPWVIDHLLGVPPGLRSEALEALGIVLLALPALLAGLALRGALEGLKRFDLANGVRIPVGIATFVLPAVAAPLGVGLVGIATLLAATRVWAVYAAARALRLAVPVWRWGTPRLSVLPQLVRYGSWVTVSNVISPIMVYGERFFLARLTGLGAVGYYTAPFEAITRLTFLASAAAAGLFPELSALSASGDRRRAAEVAWRAARYGVLVIAPPTLLAVFFARGILELWLGPPFALNAGAALQLLAAGVAFNAVAQVPATILHACGRPDLNARFHAAELPLFLAGGWWLVGRFGIPGAAAIWAFRVALDAVLLFAAASRVLGTGPAEWLWGDRGVVFAIAGLTLLLGGAAILPGPLTLRGAAALMVVLVYAFGAWHWLIEEGERERFRSLLRPSVAKW